MSKMGRLNLQLQEQAETLGFSTLQEALEAGYEVSFKNAELVGPLEQAHEESAPLGCATVEEAIADGWDSAEWLAARESEQEKAHEAWLKEKEEVIFDLKMLRKEMKHIGMDEWIESVDNAMEFIKGVRHE